jgi:hypothetical protein
MNYEKWRELASEYIEGTLAPDVALQVDAYLQTDANARAEATQLRGILGYLNTQPEVDPPLFFRENVMAAIERQKKEARQPWWNFGRMVLGSLAAGGAFALLAFKVFLPAQENDGTLRQAGSISGIAPHLVRLPEVKEVEAKTPHLGVARSVRLEKTGALYEFALTLENAPKGMARIEVPGIPVQRVALTGNLPQVIQVQPGNLSVLPVTVRWSGSGVSHESAFFVPVQKNDTVPAPRQSFGLADLPLSRTLMELATRYGQPITAENVAMEKITFALNARDETLLATLTRHLTPYGLTVTASNEGVVITKK